MERTAKKAAATPVKSGATTLLKEDHKRVKKLFKEFQSIKDREDSQDRRAELAKQLCQEITVHAQIESEIFYPAARQVLPDEDVMDEAEIEHGTVKELIARLESMQPDDHQFNAIVTVLGEYVEHHVEEEETTMFPMLKKARLDMKGLGEKITQRKEQLQSDMKSLPSEKRRSTSGGERVRATPR